MNEEEIRGLIQNAFQKTLKELQENPDNVFNYLELQEKYNRVLKDKVNLQQENQRLKKQLNNYKDSCTNRLNSLLAENLEPDSEDFYFAEIEQKANKYDELVAQQKEFIKRLENEIKRYTPNLKVNHFDEKGNRDFQYINVEVFNKQPIEILKEILLKYKEIIGVKDD